MILSKDNKLTLSMGVLCFQGFGLRIFEGVFSGAIVLWLVVLAILNFKYIKRTPFGYWVKMLVVVLLYLVFSTLKGATIVPYLIVAWLSAAVVLTPYYLGQADFVQVMRRLTKFCMYYSLCHVPIMILLKGALTTTPFGMHPKTFLYLFYFNNGEGFAGLNRIQGFCWEPSCWNLLLNLNLAFTLYFKEKKPILIASIFAIVTIMATTGLVVMAVVIGLYYITNMKRKQILQTSLVLALFVALVGPIIYSNVSEKLETGSGNSRMGDFAIAAAVIKEYPLVGIDIDNLTKNMLVIRARDEAWTSDGDYEGYMDQGMVNSFAALFVEWGVPITLLIFFLMLKSPLIEDKKFKLLYMTAVLCVLMGTPIARTGFFYMYALSTFLFYGRMNKQRTINTSIQ